MCSSASDRLARIYRAIEELASLGAAGRGVEAGESTGAGGSTDEGSGEGHGVAGSPTALRRAGGAMGESADAQGHGVADGDGRTGAEGENVADADVASRLAEIWAMIADADPELAKRLPRYLGPNS